MKDLFAKVERSPLLIRVVPFIAFLAFTSFQGKFFANSQYWFYLAKTLAGVALVAWMRPLVAEMRWRFSGEAVAVGLAVLGMWIGIDTWYPKIGGAGASAGWKPFEDFGKDSPLAWMFIVMRVLGSTLIVPPLEEVFYRSFVYRYLVKPDFQDVPLNTFRPGAFVIAAVVFGFAHHEWLAGILCAFAYQWLMIRKNHLGDVMTAHAITNCLLGVWVVWRGAWNFW